MMNALSRFESEHGLSEYYFTRAASPGRTFEEEALQLLGEYVRVRPEKAVELFLRFHLSDISTQAPVLRRLLSGRLPAFVSLVGQSPANGARIALEAWAVTGKESAPAPDVQDAGQILSCDVRLRHYSLLFYRNSRLSSEGSAAQTAEEFSTLADALRLRGASLGDHLHRTWLYCRDIDNNYQGLVNARNEFFESCGLTPQTHYITSTGIEGKHEQPNRLVGMDSWCLFGNAPGQIEYMSALSHLPPTHTYGVSFERGTRVLYGDRSTYYLSGTASIDAQGEVAHPGDVRLQTRRTLENITALMNNHGGELTDLKQAAVYLRDAADYHIVEEELLQSGFADIPHILLKAPVCRPGWLVEIDGIGVNSNGASRFAPFL